MTGEVRPADSNSTLRTQKGGDSQAMKCRIIRERGERFTVFHVQMEGASSASLKCLRIIVISDGRTDM